MAETVQKIGSDKFDSEVVKAGTPVVVDFYADWCGPCKMVSPLLEQLSQEYVGKVKFVKINTDENQELAMKFNIMSIPTIMFFRNGQVKDTVVGVAPSAVFKQKLNAIVA